MKTILTALTFACFIPAISVHGKDNKTVEVAPANFVRATDLKDKLSAIQTRTVEYKPASGKGPAIVLVGAAHLGTEEYYQTLQKRLDAATVVLYEGVGLAEALKAGPGKSGHDLGIQKQLAETLGLKFQLDVIDYRRPNFKNSDLAVEGVQQEIKQRTKNEPEAEPNQTFDTLMEALQGTGKTAEMLQPMLALLGGSEQTRETTRMLFIQVLGRAGEFLDMAKNASPELRDLLDVILTERNQIVLRDLKEQLGRLNTGDSVAVFYGAAHLPELAAAIQEKLGYTPGLEKWDTAFTADPAKAGMQPAQIKMMLDMMSQQLKAGGGGLFPGAAAPREPAGK